MRSVNRNRSYLLKWLGSLLVTLLLAGCGGHIEDTNPNDHKLQTITLEQLADSSTSWRTSGVSTVSKRYNFTILTQHEKIDFDYLKLNGGKSSGVKGILATSLKVGQFLAIETHARVDRGNLALILIAPDRRILHQFHTQGNDRYEFVAMQAGIYFIRMGAESFSGEIELQRFFR